VTVFLSNRTLTFLAASKVSADRPNVLVANVVVVTSSRDLLTDEARNPTRNLYVRDSDPAVASKCCEIL